MPASSQENAQPTAEPRSSGKPLFSQHWLLNRLPGEPEWAEDLRPVFDKVRILYAQARQQGAHWNESQTEQFLLKPMLDLLGWAYTPQPAAIKDRRLSRPDYALFADTLKRDDANPLQGDDAAFYSRALAIAEAKRWGRALSQRDPSGRDTWKAESNPSHQMVSYLYATRSVWGILTNGTIWRLYNRDVSSVASEFYEIDLGLCFDLLGPGDEPTTEHLAHFKRWWLFFRRDAFVVITRGKPFVQRVYDGSTTYAREVSENLKKLVFEEVMPGLAGGFVAYRSRQLSIAAETDESLRQIYQASLSLLYKLLFVLYAEARALLPVNEQSYYYESLTHLAKQTQERLDRKIAISDDTAATPLYGVLLALFDRIDRGEPDLKLPRYNGGLFSPANPDNQFLQQHRLSDRCVARVVDTLVRDKGEPVDYAYISVRNLGAIYEGLLENRLNVIDAASGKVELVNDKGERKASGSYYTPDYIVAYIVQHTLDPILSERQTRFEQAMDRIAALRRTLHSSAADDHTTNARLNAEREEAERDALDAFLGIKVCDPAMGSGHFLVNAVDHLTDGVIERMQAYHNSHAKVPWDWNPIQKLIETVRSDIVAEMAGQGIPIDSRRLDDTALLTRLVMKRCIYGVDLNPLAVELAKLSLWLHSFTVGAPLSFLDHHLRWGNSLIGVWDVEKYILAGADRWRELLNCLSLMVKVSSTADATIGEVRASTEAYRAARQVVLPNVKRMNVELAVLFDKALHPVAQAAQLAYVDDAERTQMLDADLISGAVLEASLSEEVRRVGTHELADIRNRIAMHRKYERAQAIAAERRFFHWKLEFPEVFVDIDRGAWAQNPGFDAVIGNPPYVSVTNIPSDDRDYLLKAFKTAVGRFDLYIVFDERSLSILRDGGMFSLIQPLKFAVFANGRSLRDMLLSQTQILSLVDVSQHDVFPDPTTYPCVPVVLKLPPSTESEVVVVRPPTTRPELIGDITDKAVVVLGIPQSRFLETPEHVISLGLSDDIWCLIKSMTGKSLAVGDQLDIEQCIRIGSKTKRDQLVLSNNQFSAAPASVRAECRKMLDGENIERFCIAWDGTWLRYIRGELYNPKSLDILERQKILVKRIAPCLSAVPDLGEDQGYFYPLNTVYALLPNAGLESSLHYVTALLNSTLLDQYYKLLFEAIAIRGGYIEYREYLKHLPIRRISFTTAADERARLGEEVRALYDAALDSRSLPDFGSLSEPLLDFVRQRLAHTPEQSDVVHDLLAHLAGQMIELNKHKQGEVKGFLTWLESVSGARVDDLPGKTTLQNYVGAYQKGEPSKTQDEALAVLRKNARKLGKGVNPFGRDFTERFAAEYATSLAKLLPIKQRLAATDRLIDQIVYLLYGLTDEEIAVVEGR